MSLRFPSFPKSLAPPLRFPPFPKSLAPPLRFERSPPFPKSCFPFRNSLKIKVCFPRSQIFSSFPRSLKIKVYFPRSHIFSSTYSCVGVWQHDRVEIIANEQGNRTTPSYVAFTDSERLIGDTAKNQVAMNPINTVFGFLDMFNRDRGASGSIDRKRINEALDKHLERSSPSISRVVNG